nr:MAG TPA: hypothetical protein [Caudoviricetes sp.]
MLFCIRLIKIQNCRKENLKTDIWDIMQWLMLKILDY